MARILARSSVTIPKSVIDKANRDASLVLRSQVSQAITDEFNSLKQQMINDFLNHPVSIEIKNGPQADNTSGTLGGYGNLFSFIGFDESETPIEDILDILEMTTIKFSQRGILTATILLPSAKQIFSVTPLRWAAGRSWAKGIESGISGLGFYIQKSGAGVSKGGFQTQKTLGKRGVANKFKPTAYISSLINKYYAAFSKISGANIKIKS